MFIIEERKTNFESDKVSEMSVDSFSSLISNSSFMFGHLEMKSLFDIMHFYGHLYFYVEFTNKLFYTLKSK